MNATGVRIGKELRSLIWPWCVLFLGGLLMALPFRSYEAHFYVLHLMSFWIGVPVLATLSLGHEFQHGTVSLLFAQPIDRLRLWREKWIVLIPAVATTTVLYLYSDAVLFPMERQISTLGEAPVGAVVVWAITVMCTATFWTLVARSVVNGLILNLLQSAGMLWLWQAGLHREALNSAALATALVYAFVMLWLGRRKLATFEVAGGTASAEVVVMRPQVSSRAFEGFLRNRPGQPTLNLIRKEVRLLWPVWLLLVACLLGTLVTGVLQFLPISASAKLSLVENLAIVDAAGIFTLGALAAVLAGSLAVSEEREWGIQFWHRTLPISAAKQWIVKIAVTLSGVSLGLLAAFKVAEFGYRGDFLSALRLSYHDHWMLQVILVAWLLTVFAFLLACVVRGTLRSSLLAFPALAVPLFLTGEVFGYFHTEAMYQRVSGVLTPAILAWHPFPLAAATISAMGGLHSESWLFAVLLLAALAQSYRMFRRQPAERLLSVVAAFAPIVIAGFLFTATLSVVQIAANRAGQLWSTAMFDALEAFHRLPAEANATPPRPVTLDELSKVFQFSDTSRIVLREVTIVRLRDSFTMRARNGFTCTGYLRTPIRVASGFGCDMHEPVVRRGSVAGRLFIDGKMAPAAVQVTLAPIEGSFPGTFTFYDDVARYQPRINPDGTFLFPDVPAARYEVGIGFYQPFPPTFTLGRKGTPTEQKGLPRLPGTAHVTDIRVGDMSVFDSGLGLGFGPTELLPLDILISTDQVIIRGKVVTPTGAPAPNATVVLKPQFRRRFSMNRTDSQGRFEFGFTPATPRFFHSAIPAGSYKLFAFEGGRVGSLEKHAEGGTPVLAKPNEPVTVELEVIKLPSR